MPEYTDTLISDRIGYVPDPEQVGGLLASLLSIGAALPSGKFRSFKNPIAGAIRSYPLRKWVKVKEFTALSNILGMIDDYDGTLEGEGPPGLSAIEFEFKGTYGLPRSLLPSGRAIGDYRMGAHGAR